MLLQLQLSIVITRCRWLGSITWWLNRNVSRLQVDDGDKIAQGWGYVFMWICLLRLSFFLLMQLASVGLQVKNYCSCSLSVHENGLAVTADLCCPHRIFISLTFSGTKNFFY
ncbi:hypothetical protein PVAP13_3KG570300 [Panicum virgatum]|uniref:Uncharacterized protein n=1 Tax=Panicum virgatum TaxID=38727 RepID=A0A8T0V2Z7_PANVG|nr:hypothetical protein PVAP13_3KG570300 [Panicum virgatum]